MSVPMNPASYGPIHPLSPLGSPTPSKSLPSPSPTIISTEQMLKSVIGDGKPTVVIHRSKIADNSQKRAASLDSGALKLVEGVKKLKSSHEPVNHQPTALKTNEVGINRLSKATTTSKPKQLTAGACKQVWVKDDVPTKAFYTALAGNRSAQKELETEVSKAQKIQKNLQKNVLYDYLGSKIVPLKLSEKPDVIGLMSTFESVKALKEAIESGDPALQVIPDEDFKKLMHYFTSVEGNAALDIAMRRGENLAIDIRVVGDAEKIEGLFTVETAKADGDLEKFIRDTENYTPAQLAEGGSQILQGMADLHKAGYVHGDIKPENVLYTKVGARLLFKISDWGKAEALNPDQQTAHVGNTRFAPWENKLSMAGDVCSTGIKLIRIFEQRILAYKRQSDPSLRSLIQPENKGSLHAANSSEKGGKKREGFEVFVIESKDFNAIEANYSKSQTILARMMQAKHMASGPTSTELSQMGKEKDKYIDALVAGMKEMHFGNENAIMNLGLLLKGMTNIDLKQRPTMEKANLLYDEIKKDLIAPQ